MDAKLAKIEAQIAKLVAKRNELEEEAINTPCGRSRDDRERQVKTLNRQLNRLYFQMADLFPDE